MYQSTKSTTRRLAAKRSAPADENSIPVNKPVKDVAVVIDAKTAALPSKLTKRSALGDKSDAYLNQKPNAATKIGKPTTRAAGGRLTIPSTKPATTAKDPTAFPAKAARTTAKIITAKGMTANVKATKNVRTTRTSTARAAVKADSENDVVVEENTVVKVVETGENSDVVSEPKDVVADSKKRVLAMKTVKETTISLEPSIEKLSIPFRRAAGTLMDVGSQLCAPSLNRASLKLLLQQEQEDSKEPLHVHEYAESIFQYMRELEARMMPDADYMDRQPEIQWHMRGILIDWLVQVHSRFGMLGETLFLCVNYIDRFLSTKVVSLQKLQLVGITALLLAAKYEEISTPTIADLVYMVDKGYDADEIKRAERYMIQMLNFDMGHPGPMSFLRRCSKADNYDQQSRTLAKYLIEAIIMDEESLHYPSSCLAAAGHMLARKLLNKGEWTPLHVHFSGYTLGEISHLADTMLERVREPTSHQSIFDKYADRKYMKASIFVQQWFEKNKSL